jgi:hypothetical protein
MAASLTGKLYGDKGYLSKALTGELLENGVELISNVRSNMKKKRSHYGIKVCYQNGI